MSSGKWYYEVIVKPNTSGSSTSWGMLGVALDRAHDPALNCYPGYFDTNSEGWEFQTGRLYGSNGASGWSGVGVAAGDVIGVYIDTDVRTVGFAKNCTFLGTAFVNLWSGALYPVLVDSCRTTTRVSAIPS